MDEDNTTPLEEEASYEEHKKKIEQQVAEAKERESNQGVSKRIEQLEKQQQRFSKQKPAQQYKSKEQVRKDFLARLQKSKGLNKGAERLTKAIMPSQPQTRKASSIKNSRPLQQRRGFSKSFIDSRSPVSSSHISSGVQTLNGSNRDKASALARYNQIKQRRLMEAIYKNNQMSQNTQQMLSRLADVQNKGKIDDLEMQRRLAERRIVSQAGNLLATPNIFQEDPNRLNSWLVDSEHLITSAPNVFKENPNNPNITITGRPNILQTAQTGNNLTLFGDPVKQDDQKPVNTRLNFWKS